MNINMDTIVKDNDVHLRDKSAPVSLPLSEEDKNTLIELLNYVKESTDPDLAERKSAPGSRYRRHSDRCSQAAFGRGRR